MTFSMATDRKTRTNVSIVVTWSRSPSPSHRYPAPQVEDLRDHLLHLDLGHGRDALRRSCSAPRCSALASPSSPRRWPPTPRGVPSPPGSPSPRGTGLPHTP